MRISLLKERLNVRSRLSIVTVEEEMVLPSIQLGYVNLLAVGVPRYVRQVMLRVATCS